LLSRLDFDFGHTVNNLLRAHRKIDIVSKDTCNELEYLFVSELGKRLGLIAFEFLP